MNHNFYIYLCLFAVSGLPDHNQRPDHRAGLLPPGGRGSGQLRPHRHTGRPSASLLIMGSHSHQRCCRCVHVVKLCCFGKYRYFFQYHGYFQGEIKIFQVITCRSLDDPITVKKENNIVWTIFYRKKSFRERIFCYQREI